MSLAGRIDGEVGGRPMSLVAESQNLVVNLGSLRALWMIRRGSRAIIQPLRSFVARSDIRLFVGIKWWGRVEVYPNPSFLVRMLLSVE